MFRPENYTAYTSQIQNGSQWILVMLLEMKTRFRICLSFCSTGILRFIFPLFQILDLLKLIKNAKTVVINFRGDCNRMKGRSKLEYPRHCNGMLHHIRVSSFSWLVLWYTLRGLLRPFSLLSLLLPCISLPSLHKVGAFDSFSHRHFFSLHFWQDIYY